MRKTARNNNRTLRGIQGLLNLVGNHYRANRRIELETERVRILQQQRQLNEMRIAQASNNVLLGDLKIEEQKLKIRAMKRALMGSQEANNFAKPIDEWGEEKKHD